MDKKGQDSMGVIGLVVTIIIAVILIWAALAMGFKGQSGFLGSLSSFLINIFSPNSGGLFGVLGSWLVVIKDALFKIAVPTAAGLSADQEVIAFAVFLLMILVGTHALKNTMNGLFAFALSFIVAIIASRSLTAEIIKSYISGSPVASAIFLVGIIPILAFYGAIKKFRLQSWTKLLVWFLFAVAYVIAYTLFDNASMGWLYFVVIILAGVAETVGKVWSRAKRMAKWKGVGHNLVRAETIENRGAVISKELDEGQRNESLGAVGPV